MGGGRSPPPPSNPLHPLHPPAPPSQELEERKAALKALQHQLAEESASVRELEAGAWRACTGRVSGRGGPLGARRPVVFPPLPRWVEALFGCARSCLRGPHPTPPLPLSSATTPELRSWQSSLTEEQVEAHIAELNQKVFWRGASHASCAGIEMRGIGLEVSCQESLPTRGENVLRTVPQASQLGRVCTHA